MIDETFIRLNFFQHAQKIPSKIVFILTSDCINQSKKNALVINTL